MERTANEIGAKRGTAVGMLGTCLSRSEASLFPQARRRGSNMPPLNLPELEVSGLALVTAIDNCPPIAGGEGS